MGYERQSENHSSATKQKAEMALRSRGRDFERNCGKQQQIVLRRRHNVQACTFSQGKSFAKEQQPLIKVLQAKTVFSLVNAVFWEKKWQFV